FAGLTCLLLLQAGGASAATVLNFRTNVGNLGATGNLGSLHTFSADDVTFQATSIGGDLFTANTGLGVSGAPAGNNLGTNATVSESLTLDFMQDVVLTDIVFWEHRAGDETFEIRDGSNNLLTTISVANGSNRSSFQTVSGLALTGSVFTIQHVAGSGGRLSAITVIPAQIPIPAAGGMLLASLATFGFISRRRRKAA
ncbi:MAG: hypothetical protein AAFQ09_10865, partial [Pseudomonadota bacterium]